MAMEVEYLRDWDLLWMASDAKGQVGVFITAGEGPIPKTMVSGIDDLAEVEEEILRLPPRCEHRLLASMPRPDDFIALAERGLFVYDWQDVHRTAAAATHCFEHIALPTKPLSIGALEGRLGKWAAMLVFEQVDFSNAASLDVISLVG